jgi:hypothetical protein
MLTPSGPVDATRARLAAAVLLAAIVALLARPARADDDSELRRPERMTVSVADALLGQLSADGKTLYFVSNRDTTSQIFAQNVADGRARKLFDDDADVTWPRVSPDGRSLLYISFREQVSGQLCIRSLPDGDARRCLADRSAALEAEWIDRERIALVSRRSIAGDLRVIEVTVRSTLEVRPLLDRNLTSPAVSPDGRWLVYVPVERTVETVGPGFAARAAPQLEAVRLTPGASPAPRLRVALDLPGQTGQPAFARDGRSLYVVQFFTDTNHDGAVDASDDGVLFRVPISFDSGAPIAGAPEQLTDTARSCEYPAPFQDRLLMTCARNASLDVYSLPLDGEVPADWTAETLTTAAENAPTLIEEQLLASRRLARETTHLGQRRAMLRLAMVHLAREEFRAAEFYAERLDALRDEATAGISRPLRALVEQRRASRRREQGRMMEGFGKEARARLLALLPDPTGSLAADVLRHVVRSEIAASVGDVAQARTELEAVTIDETTPSAVARAYYEQADALYRELDDPGALVSVCRRLATSGALAPDDQLRYARAAVRAMVRGLPYDAALARLERERASITTGEPELTFAIDLARAVLAVRDARAPRAVIDALLALYAAQGRPGRRRALMGDAVQRAEDVNADVVLESLAARDIEDVKRGTRERRSAERLFRRVMTDRAYARAAERRFAEARADFDAVAEQTRSYEAIVGAIDMRLRSGEPAADIEAVYARRSATPAIASFAKAYLLARQLPKLEGEAHAGAAARALSALRASWSELKPQRIAQALFGALLHEQYLLTSDLATAEKASARYLIALELVGPNPRFRAMILGELGLLHARVGNHRIALGYLLERDKIPYKDGAEGLDVHLAEARALLHVGRNEEAATTADAALAMIGRAPALARYRVLALDRAAMSNLAAGRFARALALYDEEIPMLGRVSDVLAERNGIVTRVSRAAAAVGAGQPARALSDLDDVEARLGDPKVAEALRWPHSTAERVVLAYRLVTTGLRARASRALAHLDAEAHAIEARRALLEERLGKTRRVEIEREVLLAEAQLAINAGERGDAPAATLWLGRALSHADDLRARAHGVAGREDLDVVRLAAELTVSMGRSLVANLPGRIDASRADLAARREPALRTQERWLEIYGALASPAGSSSPGSPPPP